MTRDPFRNYDAWLEAPYQRMQEEGERETDAWEEYCSEEGIDEGVADPDHSDHAVYETWYREIYLAEDLREIGVQDEPDMLE